jgi:hypothetical protein
VGPPPPTPLARFAIAVAALIALSAAPASAAGEPGFLAARTLGEANGFVAAPALGADGRAAVAVTDFATDRSRVVAYTRAARGRWSGARVLRSSRQELLEPAAAFTGDGTGVFAWVRAPRIDQEQLVESRRLLGSGAFEPVRTLSTPGERALLTRVAAGPGSLALVGWEDADSALRVSETGSGEAGAGAAQTIFARRQFAYSLAHLPDGTAVALSQSFGAGGVQVRLRPPGASWGTPVTLSGARTAREASLAAGGDGTVAVAWAQHTDTGYRVQLSVRPPGGEFSSARTVAGDGGEARAPGLAVQPDGTVLVAWVASAELSFLVRGGEVRMAAVTSDGDVSTAQRASSEGRRIAAAPQVFTDAAGDALVTWEEGRRLVAATRSASGRLGAPEFVSPAGVRVFTPRVVANARGQALAAWAVERPGGAVIQVAEAAF